MKKWILLSICVLAAGILCVEVFIPSTLTISRVVPMQCRAVAAFPFLSDEGRWERWWPDSRLRKDFHIQRLSYQSVDIAIRDGQELLDSRMNLLPVGIQDSSLLHWETQLHCGWSPVDRIKQYQQAGRLTERMDGILGQASAFLGKKENLYGVRIGEGSTRDTLLIAVRTEKMGLPTNEDIYVQIGRLMRYITETHTQQAGYPMVNFSAIEDRPGAYRLMVAIPVAGRMESRGDLVFMRLVPGKYLTTEVTGGPGSVAAALSGLKDYIRDYQRTIMAIPFQSLVTDRMQVTDTTRWVTRIYYPIL